MKTIAEIGSDRLNNVLVRDKNESPAKLINILKSELNNLFNSYVELDDIIDIKMITTQGKINFEIKIKAVRIKEYGKVAN